jgi:hypothetical protein
VQDGLLAPVVPFDGDPRPVLFGDGAEVVVVVAPADAGADVEQSGLGAGHTVCRVFAILLERRHPSSLAGRLATKPFNATAWLSATTRDTYCIG